MDKFRLHEWCDLFLISIDASKEFLSKFNYQYKNLGIIFKCDQL